ncbi:MAG: hypothetical protein LIP01_11555 [Tannerellaceae bacterium]|nr:hypothetical protein [Tannerellaceae bacterium]
MKYILTTCLFLFCFFIVVPLSWAQSVNPSNNPVAFPYLFETEPSGRISYLNYITKRNFNELTNKLYTGFLGKRRWIGPNDLFMEYEILTIDPVRENDTIAPLYNTYRCLAWIPDGEQIALKILSDKYTRGEKNGTVKQIPTGGISVL